MRLFFVAFLLTLSLQGASQEEPQAYILKSIYFGGGSYYFDDYQFQELSTLVDSIPNIRDYSVTIHSHTDNIGGAAYNEWLSRKRSDAAINRLIQLEFDFNQIEIKDFGQYNAIFDNSTWEGRSLNRRVDIIFWPIVM